MHGEHRMQALWTRRFGVRSNKLRQRLPFFIIGRKVSFCIMAHRNAFIVSSFRAVMQSAEQPF